MNLAGGEFGENKRPGRFGFDYLYPEAAAVDHFAGLGFRLIRVPFLADRLAERDARGRLSLRKADLAAIEAVVARARTRGVHVILDLHEFGRMAGGLVGRDKPATLTFSEFWDLAARHFARSPNVIFGLMNEPFHQTPAEALAAWRCA